MGGINCSKCGKWVGKDGYLDIVWDDYNGGWEMGYPLCGPCLKKQTENEQGHRADRKGRRLIATIGDLCS